MLQGCALNLHAIGQDKRPGKGAGGDAPIKQIPIRVAG